MGILKDALGGVAKAVIMTATVSAKAVKKRLLKTIGSTHPKDTKK